jgi:hypothetical protein
MMVAGVADELRTNYQTPLPVQIHPYTDASRRPSAVVIAKSTWRLDSGRLSPPEQQAGLFNQPQRRCLGDFDLDTAQRQALGTCEQEVPILCSIRSQTIFRSSQIGG